MMIKRVLSLLLASLLILTQSFAAAAAKTDVSGEIEKLIKHSAAASGSNDIQEWVDRTLSADVISGNWYIIALRQYGAACDFSAYRESLEQYVLLNEPDSVTKQLRAALTLKALESDSPYISQAANTLPAEDGLMPLVFGLHLMNNGVTSDTCSSESVALRLIDMQLDDGGWAVVGEHSDIDSTAMTVQALAPMYTEDPRVKAAIDSAIELLSEMQLDSGGFCSMSGENPESSAQVIIALSSLGIDCSKDVRFIKNGSTIVDAMLSFGLSDGGIAHDRAHSGSDDMAVTQVLSALVAYQRMLDGNGAYYIFDAPLPNVAENGISASVKYPLRLYLCGAILLLAAAALIVCAVRKKLDWRSYAFIAVTAAVLIAAVLALNIESTAEHYSSSEQKEASVATYISISCESVAGANLNIPADGIILDSTKIMTAPGATAYDQLVAAAKEYGIQLECEGTAVSAYVEGIAYIYEGDFGELSGWMFRINGDFADEGCSSYRLCEGDSVEWIYSTDLGKDVGDSFILIPN